jgi:hypothetical protein
MNIIMVGGGRVVYFLARIFASKGYRTTIVNRDAEECVRLSRELKATVMSGDGSHPSVLAEAGARRAQALLASRPGIRDNLMAANWLKGCMASPGPSPWSTTRTTASFFSAWASPIPFPPRISCQAD